MATVSKWNPFGVALDITATAGTVTRISATSFTVVLTVSWETYYSGNKTNYGMSATSGGVTKTISAFDGTKRSSGSGTFTGTYSISGNGAATKTITVTFKNFNTDNGDNASKNVTLSVAVPALPSWTIAYNANGGSNAPSSQTKWKDQSLTLSSTEPTRTGYTFKGWATSASGAVAYAAGASYTANAAATLYAVWQANTYTVKYDANGGTGAPGNQTKSYGTTLILSSTIPTRANYKFIGWGTSASSTTATYAAGGSYTANAAVTLYAVWEIAYIKPIIYNISAVRCDNTGRLTEEGTYAKLSFNWETYFSNPLIVINITYGGGSWSYAEFNQTGTIGTFSEVISEGDLNSDGTFEIGISIIDAPDDPNGNTSVVTTLSGAKFPIDAIKDTDTWEVGVAFGKPAEKIGVAEFALDAEFNKPVYGNVLGLNKLPAIPEGAELNDYINTGAWAIYSNAVAATITCGGVLLGTNNSVPPARAGRFEVNSATGEGIRAEEWSYLRQRFIPYNDSNPTYERDIARGEDNIWNYYDWWRSSLSPAASQKVYDKAAITIGLSANSTMTVASAYTLIPFNTNVAQKNYRLGRLNSGQIIIVANGIDYVKVSANILVKCGAAGTRHFRIQKTSGSTTTSHAWTVLNAAAGSNTAFNFTPIIIPVKVGDLIQIVYYTADTTDYIVAGSSANGQQTYLTVEEL